MTRTETPQWLTLKQASELLGIHNTTLRSWADRGAIPVFRTPGGHRRFNASDLRRFLAARISETGIVDSHALVEIAVERVREQMGKLPPATHQWAISQDEEERTLRRRRGRQLFALALAYVMKPSQRQQIMEDGRKLGRDYGREAAQKRISLVETGRAVQFFRNQLIEAMRDQEGSGSLDADDIRIHGYLNHFIDEVLYAVLAGFEQP